MLLQKLRDGVNNLEAEPMDIGFRTVLHVFSSASPVCSGMRVRCDDWSRGEGGKCLESERPVYIRLMQPTVTDTSSGGQVRGGQGESWNDRTSWYTIVCRKYRRGRKENRKKGKSQLPRPVSLGWSDTVRRARKGREKGDFCDANMRQRGVCPVGAV